MTPKTKPVQIEIITINDPAGFVALRPKNMSATQLLCYELVMADMARKGYKGPKTTGTYLVWITVAIRSFYRFNYKKVK